MKLFQKLIKRLFTRRVRQITRYHINGQEVSEETWYANGGLEAEAQMDKFKEACKRQGYFP